MTNALKCCAHPHPRLLCLSLLRSIHLDGNNNRNKQGWDGFQNVLFNAESPSTFSLSLSLAVFEIETSPSMNPESPSPLPSQRVASILEILLHIIGYVDASTLSALCLVSSRFYEIIKANELQLAKPLFRQLYRGCGCEDLEPSNWPGKTVRDIQRIVHRHTTSEKLAARLLQAHDPVDGFKFSVAATDPWGYPARRRIQQGLCVYYSCGDIATEMYNATFADLGISPRHHSPPSISSRLRQQALKTVFRKKGRKNEDDDDSESAQREDLICQRHGDYLRTLAPQRLVSFYIVQQLLCCEISVAWRHPLDQLLGRPFPGYGCFIARQTTRWFSLFLYDWDGRYEKRGPGVQEALEEVHAYHIVHVRNKHLRECHRANCQPSYSNTAERWLKVFYLRYGTSPYAVYSDNWPNSLDAFTSED